MCSLFLVLGLLITTAVRFIKKENHQRLLLWEVSVMQQRLSTWQGQMFVAFVIDVYARRIVGWRVSSHMRTDFVVDALEQALCVRQPAPQDGCLIHHSDRGSLCATPSAWQRQD